MCIRDSYPSLSGTAFGIALAIALIGQTAMNGLMGMVFTYDNGISEQIPVVRTTRVGNGMVSGEHIDRQTGTIPGGLLTPAKARILLSLALQKTKDRRSLE